MAAPLRFGVGEPDLRDPPLAPGEIVGGRYRVVRLLGEGGMGRVYEAEHVLLGQRVAIKLLRRDRQSAEHLARFRQEAEAAGRIGHPAIVGVSDFGGRDEGHAYMVMELLRGESMESWLARPGSLRAGLEAIVEVARGLHAAHLAGVVHRDLKPANLFLHHGVDGRVHAKILDFGIAKLASTEHTAIATAAGTVLGTPYYLAPERALGRALDARADLYSLGVILFELATGTVPFLDETFMGVLAKHVRVMPLDPRQAAPDRGVPDGLARLIMVLLAKDPAQRTASAELLAAELERLLVDEDAAIAAVRTGPREHGGDAMATVHIDEIA
ncbi:MAG: serine/threonine protein kinase, partial [Deltaproteobacteria bacterium]|nr:serine/threonine protein kinase [Nannocystaceae bacterium]